ncbi:MAG: hypothetical protein RIB45_00625 [Marivibrio sp.]|uniref:endonuclease/exonuclease/phosphatase family protein n=1 Tax=Marivibrio sp. TaxID=2039719 RepID=UPI0032EC9F6E
MSAINVASFNLYQYAAPPLSWYDRGNSYDPDAWDEKQRWIARILSNAALDLVGFQEIFSPEPLQALCAGAGLAHFATADAPKASEADPQVMVGPVVGLASRYPIRDAKPVAFPEEIKPDLSVHADAHFYRTPIQAVVELPGIGPTTVIVAHLKSKRALVTAPDLGPDASREEVVREDLRAISRGQIAAMLQRGAEAAALYHVASGLLRDEEWRPLLILGDLNDDAYSVPLQAILHDRVFEIAGVSWSDLSSNDKRLVYNLKLGDSWSLQPRERRAEARPATHYYRGKGSVLDYVIASNAFNSFNPRAVGRVVTAGVLDEHLLLAEDMGWGERKGYLRTKSDHAIATASLGRRPDDE